MLRLAGKLHGLLGSASGCSWFVLSVWLACPSLAAGRIWDPQDTGQPMTEYVYMPLSGPTVTWGAGNAVTWAERAGFTMSLDDAQVYDNWPSSGADDAPQVRFDIGPDGDLSLFEADFAVTVQTRLTDGYGSNFHAGLCIGFGINDLMVWGPHGSTDLRLRRPGWIDQTIPFPHEVAFLKIKRYWERHEEPDGTEWYSAHY